MNYITYKRDDITLIEYFNLIIQYFSKYPNTVKLFGVKQLSS